MVEEVIIIIVGLSYIDNPRMMIADIGCPEDIIILEMNQITPGMNFSLHDLEKFPIPKKESEFLIKSFMMHEEEVNVKCILQSSPDYLLKEVVTKTNARSRKHSLQRFSAEMSRHPP
jgi:hypothetical protein